jgi:dipeptidyl aminopeptidase/acylaminoacyl peptidase
MDEKAGFDSSGGYSQVSSRVQAVAEFCGPVDFLQKKDSPLYAKLFGGSFESKANIWNSASPLNYVTSDAPPFLIVHGDNDKTVPIIHSEKMHETLSAAGVPSRFIVVRGGAHNLRGTADAPAKPAFNELLHNVADFFDEHIKAKIKNGLK